MPVNKWALGTNTVNINGATSSNLNNGVVSTTNAGANTVTVAHRRHPSSPAGPTAPTPGTGGQVSDHRHTRQRCDPGRPRRRRRRQQLRRGRRPGRNRRGYGHGPLGFRQRHRRHGDTGLGTQRRPGERRHGRRPDLRVGHGHDRGQGRHQGVGRRQCVGLHWRDHHRGRRHRRNRHQRDRQHQPFNTTAKARAEVDAATARLSTAARAFSPRTTSLAAGNTTSPSTPSRRYGRHQQPRRRHRRPRAQPGPDHGDQQRLHQRHRRRRHRREQPQLAGNLATGNVVVNGSGAITVNVGAGRGAGIDVISDLGNETVGSTGTGYNGAINNKDGDNGIDAQITNVDQQGQRLGHHRRGRHDRNRRDRQHQERHHRHHRGPGFGHGGRRAATSALSPIR